MNMNVLMLLTNKADTAYLYENDTIRDGLEKLRQSGYTAIPVLDREGHYVGSVSEGDFLWNLIDHRMEKEFTGKRVRHIMRKDFSPAVRIDVPMESLLSSAIRQNFIPVTDDRGFFIGIVTRKDIILTYDKLLQEKK